MKNGFCDQQAEVKKVSCYFAIPSPGTPDGPCRGECSHPKCHAARALARKRCAECNQFLGFGTRIPGEPPIHL